MSTIHTKYGYEFRRDLISQNRDAWLKAVGQELEKKGISVKVGEGAHAQEIKNSDQLNAFFARHQSNPIQAKSLKKSDFPQEKMFALTSMT